MDHALTGKTGRLYRQAHSVGPVPAAVLETLHRSTEELIASGQADRAVKAGETAPEFVLPDPDGNPVISARMSNSLKTSFGSPQQQDSRYRRS
jgi:hypothetical protein